ncbi:porin family protein [Wenzhouxiangella sp. EGI_FJ10409]|uniref:hypothetical protein n=1 Tax=Wenzhouxiangella sp. EGI_FJ10409 TaxID=3243767 RepID=UPI0035DED2BF
MSRLKHILLIVFALIAAGAQAQVGNDVPWSIVPENRAEAPESAPPPAVQLASDRSPLGLPGERPRLSMTMPLSGNRSALSDGDNGGSAFSWSLKAWQMNTASLAHIQCSQGTMTMNSYLAEDCRFVDRPLPSDSMNLLQVSGDWMAAPGLKLGISAFRGDDAPATAEQPFAFELDPELLARNAGEDIDSAVEGLDVNVSFGIQTERIGDFLVGLQLARYRQRMSMAELGMSFDPLETVSDMRYSNSAQVLLGWRRGNFSGEMLGQHREVPLWLGPEQAPSTLNSFDLEFSWQAQRNASLSIGVSNVMDAAPRADEASPDAALEDPLESVYGRIPYVRYKHDL